MTHWLEWPAFKAAHPTEAITARRNCQRDRWPLKHCIFRVDLYGRVDVALCHPYT